MDARPYEPGDLDSLAALIDSHLAVVPPFLPCGAETARVVQSGPDPWQVHYPDDSSRTVREWTPCVLGPEGLRAAARIRRIDPADKEGGPGHCHVDWLAADPAIPESGSLLIAVIEEKAREWDCPTVGISGRNFLGVGWYGVPDAWPHLMDRFEKAGWEGYEPWLILHGPSYPGGPDAPGFEFRMNAREETGEWELTAFAGGRKAGECHIWGIPPHLAGVPGMEKWITLEYVGVEEEFQRRGLGCYLVLEQMRFHRERGASRAGRGLALPTLGIENFILWTEPDNHAARGLFESLGFAYGPVCWQFRKRLK